MCKVHIKGHGKKRVMAVRDSYTLLPVVRFNKYLISLI